VRAQLSVKAVGFAARFRRRSGGCWSIADDNARPSLVVPSKRLTGTFPLVTGLTARVKMLLSHRGISLVELYHRGYAGQEEWGYLLGD
jgi:hypothetical protein